MDPFGQLEEQGSRNGRLASRLGRLVLGLDGRSNAGYAVPQQDLGQEPLVLGQCGQCGLAVGATGPEARSPGLLGLGSRPATGASIGTVPITTPTLAPTGTTVALAAGPTTVTVTAGSSAPAVAIASITAPATPPVASVAITTGAVVVTSTVALSGQARGDKWFVSSGAQHLEEVGGLACPLGGQHRGHLDAVHELFELHAENVSNRRSGRYEIGTHRTLRLAGAGGPPRPLAVIACAGELDLHAWHGEER